MPASLSRRPEVGALRPATPTGPPPSAAQVRRTRSWMLLLLLSPVCFLVVLYIAFGTAGQREPVVHPRSVPAGWAPVTDSDFGYAVPASYRPSAVWSDQNGDFFYGTPRAFVAETMLLAQRAPAATAAPPVAFRTFGRQRPVTLTLSDARPVGVPGTAAAWEYDVRGPGGFRAVAVDSWEPATSTQMWLLVHAPPAVTSAVVSSLRG